MKMPDIVKKTAEWTFKWGFRILGFLPAQKKLVIFESFFGRQYSCNPRAIYEYMEDHMNDYELVWSVHPRYVSLFDRHHVAYVRRFSLKWFWMMARASYWITNVRLPQWMIKPQHTVYIQTWHGTPLKRLALDMEEVHLPGTDPMKYKSEFVAESSRWDYLISPNRYSSTIFSRAFAFRGTIVETGYPRNDYLYQANNQESINKLKKRCGLPNDRKVILYAPTWRDDRFYSKGRYKFDLHLDLDRMRTALGEKYVVLLRLHYLVADQLDLSDFEGFAYDVSKFEDIRGLYLISDLLITDYSSVFFDYANLRRPMIFFAYDIDMYRDHLRGFYFDFEKRAPGPIVRTTEGVIQAIQEAERTHFKVPENFESFYQVFCSLENGRASEAVVKQIFNRK